MCSKVVNWILALYSWIAHAPSRILGEAKSRINTMKRAIAENIAAYYAVSIILLALAVGALIVLHGKGTIAFWYWTAQSWQAVGTVAALTGVIGIFYQVAQNSKRQRKETGPYVRVDIGPTVGNAASPFPRPAAYIMLARDYIDVAGGGSAVPDVSVSAWLRNYQVHPLGMCFTLQAEFHYTAFDPAGNPFIGGGIWEVAYLEHDKPVQIELFRLPKNWSILVELFSLRYQDFHGAKQSFSPYFSTGIHGRLRCTYDPQDGFESLPIAFPRTPG